MTTLTIPTPAVKPQRVLNLQGDLLTLKVRGRRKGTLETYRYRITRLPCPIGGQAFRLERLETPRPDDDGGQYDVHLEADDTASCECRGFLRWNRCKHVDACRKLIALDLI